jgi:hypothetical protein
MAKQSSTHQVVQFLKANELMVKDKAKVLSNTKMVPGKLVNGKMIFKKEFIISLSLNKKFLIKVSLKMVNHLMAFLSTDGILISKEIGKKDSSLMVK